jgi:hypothetical protein
MCVPTGWAIAFFNTNTTKDVTYIANSPVELEDLESPIHGPPSYNVITNHTVPRDLKSTFPDDKSLPSH